MKKIFYSFSLILFIPFIIISQEINKYEIIQVKQIPVGNDKGELGHKPVMIGGVPLGLGFDLDHNLYISDDGNKNCIIYNNDFSYIRDLKQKFISTIRIFEFQDDKIINKGWHDFFSAFDNSGNLLFYISFVKKNLLLFSVNLNTLILLLELPS